MLIATIMAITMSLNIFLLTANAQHATSPNITVATNGTNNQADLINSILSKKEPITREQLAVVLIESLGLSQVAQDLKDIKCPFTDVESNKGPIIMANDLGLLKGVSETVFNPKDDVTRAQLEIVLSRVNHKLNKGIEQLHGFYAINSYPQRDMIKDFNSIGYGWSQLVYNSEEKKVVLETKKKTGQNDYGIPSDYKSLVTDTAKMNVDQYLMIHGVKNMNQMLASPKAQEQAVDIIKEFITDWCQKSKQFKGIIMDIEGLTGTSRVTYVQFITKIQGVMRSLDKELYLTVQGPEYYYGYDYKALGNLADRIILMAHDYEAKRLTPAEQKMTYFVGHNTPISPLDKVYEDMRFLTDPISGLEDPSKLMLQISFGSCLWQVEEDKIINSKAKTPGYQAIYDSLMSGEGISRQYLLGLLNTHFKNASGLYVPGHYSTAEDIGKLAKLLITKYPEILEISDTIQMDTYRLRDGVSTYYRLDTTNDMLKEYSWANGLKTGFHDQAGYCLVTTAQKDGRLLISVVMGCSTNESRLEDSKNLLNYGFKYP